MYYAIKHLTLFTYSQPIYDSVMELRMQPRGDGLQRNIDFDLRISPNANPQTYRDYTGNIIHTFDIPGVHDRLAIQTEGLIEVKAAPAVPEKLDADAWDAIDAKTAEPEYYDMLLPGTFARSTPLLETFASELDVRRRDDPLTLLRELNTAIYGTLEYMPNVTGVDSPIDEALTARRGVCQDFAHIMLALVRGIGIPCRYVSGYLFHRDDADRSAEDATHAWVEAWLPTCGWVGFDPTNDLICMDRHIRVAVGQDYADVPPTKGVFKGGADSTLEVRVQVSALKELPQDENADFAPQIQLPHYSVYTQQQQQQQ